MGILSIHKIDLVQIKTLKHHYTIRNKYSKKSMADCRKGKGNRTERPRHLSNCQGSQIMEEQHQKKLRKRQDEREDA